MSFRRFLLVTWFLVTSVASGQLLGPGWHAIEAEPVSVEEALHQLQELRAVSGAEKSAKSTVSSKDAGSIKQMSASLVPVEYPTEIVSWYGAGERPPENLQLRQDTYRFHSCVCPSARGFGNIDRAAGGDLDQAALLVDLLRCAGYEANYVFGSQVMPVAALANWLDVAPDPIIIKYYLDQAGFRPIPCCRGCVSREYGWRLRQPMVPIS